MSSSSLFVPSSCSSEMTLAACPLNLDGLTGIVWEVSEGGTTSVVPVGVTSMGAIYSRVDLLAHHVGPSTMSVFQYQ
ncbi:hypothetical protein GOBAR_AA34197 [Gossypium barbadense]|uniref:Uncharacterized protein n=1 Tax=Gossypium barbadense TaxID=3634 RepID=A0A2P5W5Y4_GOSBA|nr:hypothetical protein GOBAR_AA34197 [Gossypium barbadense]